MCVCDCRYGSLVTGHRAKATIALCWLLSAVIGMTPMMGWNTGGLRRLPRVKGQRYGLDWRSGIKVRLREETTEGQGSGTDRG